MNPLDAIYLLAVLNVFLMLLVIGEAILEAIGTGRVARWLRLPDDFE